MTACAEDGGADAGRVGGLADVSGELQGEGATSQQRAMDRFASLFEVAAPGSTLSYNATGSGSGQSRFLDGQVAFAGSDSPLQGEQVAAARERCGGNDALHLPMVIGPVAVAYNLEGVDLTLTPPLIARIFDGSITSWDDPAIAEVNEGAALPAERIRVVYRSEESGTSDNFMRFLSAAAPGDWRLEHSKSFPSATGSGASGSAGVADEVSQVPGAITYVESGFARDKGLGIAAIDFGAGPVRPTPETVNSALATLEYSGEGADMVVDSGKLFAMREAGAYPLVLTTYEIVCSAGYDGRTRDLLKNFLHVVLETGQDEALAELGYIPVQGGFKDRLAAAVDSIS
ncbi:MAG: phosphate ABC transporter substrate-binding protein PstS [Corynebacterium sphenisci]|nr:phosphate ABC transporter substrate-binding protein PstS [Corynebacterium sphenisci]MDO5730188.1 phosphate ABC transporter substrate-binding protein PstS [Corynebacterium sphenisci]